MTEYTAIENGAAERVIRHGEHARDILGRGLRLEAGPSGNPVIGGAEEVEVVSGLPWRVHNRDEATSGMQEAAYIRQAVLAIYPPSEEDCIFRPRIEQSLAAPETMQASMLAGVADEIHAGENALADFGRDEVSAIVAIGKYYEPRLEGATGADRARTYATVYLADVS